MNNSELRQMKIYMKQCEDFRQLLEVADLENAYLKKKIGQLEKRLEEMEE
jgi:hypothetical protein